MSLSIDNQRSIENISILWEKENSNESFVLVLPDTLRSKYYLKDYKGINERNKAKNERNMIRYEFLSRKSATAEMKNNKKKIEIELSYEKKCTKGLVERNLDERLLNPLRNDEKSIEAFMKRVEEIKSRRHKPRQKTVVAPVIPLVELRSMFLEREKVRSFAAISRRESLAQSPPRTSESFMEEVSVSTPAIPQNKEIIASKWLALSANFQRLNNLFRVLENHRKITSQFDLENKAARIIQCRWRRVEMIPAMAVVVRKVLATGGRVQGRLLLKHRQEAVSIITSILSLSNGGIKGLVKGYIRKVKKLQGIFRKQIVVNLSRLGLLNTIFDRAFVSIFHLIGLIIAGKFPSKVTSEVFDKLGNLNELKLIKQMLTINFYTKFYNILNGNVNLLNNLKLFRKDFLSGKFEFNLNVKSQVLRSLLSKKRKVHFHIRKNKLKNISKIPKVTENEVRNYILGGKDPLQEHVMKLDPSYHDSSNSDLLHHTKSLHLNQHNQQSHQQSHQQSYEPFLLINSISVNDLLEAIIEYVEKHTETKRVKVKLNTQYSSFGTALVNAAGTPFQTPSQRQTTISISGIPTPQQINRRKASSLTPSSFNLINSSNKPMSSIHPKFVNRNIFSVNEYDEMDERRKNEDDDEDDDDVVQLELRPVTPPKHEKPSSIIRNSRRFTKKISV